MVVPCARWVPTPSAPPRRCPTRTRRRRRRARACRRSPGTIRAAGQVAGARLVRRAPARVDPVPSDRQGVLAPRPTAGPRRAPRSTCARCCCRAAISRNLHVRDRRRPVRSAGDPSQASRPAPRQPAASPRAAGTTPAASGTSAARATAARSGSEQRSPRPRPARRRDHQPAGRAASSAPAAPSASASTASRQTRRGPPVAALDRRARSRGRGRRPAAPARGPARATAAAEATVSRQPVRRSRRAGRRAATTTWPISPAVAVRAGLDPAVDADRARRCRCPAPRRGSAGAAPGAEPGLGQRRRRAGRGPARPAAAAARRAGRAAARPASRGWPSSRPPRPRRRRARAPRRRPPAAGPPNALDAVRPQVGGEVQHRRHHGVRPALRAGRAAGLVQRRAVRRRSGRLSCRCRPRPGR